MNILDSYTVCFEDLGRRVIRIQGLLAVSPDHAKSMAYLCLEIDRQIDPNTVQCVSCQLDQVN